MLRLRPSGDAQHEREHNRHQRLPSDSDAASPHERIRGTFASINPEDDESPQAAWAVEEGYL
jgi:hypothetical protein